MANICSFEMRVKGEKNNIEKFYDAMIQKDTTFMGRGASADIVFEEDKVASITGWCKWSVNSSLINNAISMRETPEKWAFPNVDNVSEIEFITLIEASKKWQLKIEVYSEETGYGFQEHLLIIDGDVLTSETKDYTEIYLREYSSKKEAEEELNIPLTDEEWEEDYIGIGGFESWDFEI